MGYFEGWSLGESSQKVLGSGKYWWPGLRKFRESSADTSSAPIRQWGWTVNISSLSRVYHLSACATLSCSQLLTLGVHSRWSWLRVSREVNMVLLPDWPCGHQGTTPTLYESQTPVQFPVVAVRFAESLWYNQHRTCTLLSIMSHFKSAMRQLLRGPRIVQASRLATPGRWGARRYENSTLPVKDDLFTNISPS